MIASAKTAMTYSIGIGYAKRGGAPEDFLKELDRKRKALQSEDLRLIAETSREAALGTWPYAQDLLTYGELEAVRREARRAAEITSGHAHE
jgi:hypothetical protein